MKFLVVINSVDKFVADYLYHRNRSTLSSVVIFRMQRFFDSYCLIS